MPAGFVRPLASQAPKIGPWLAREYAACGWRITEHGLPDTGSPLGPCAQCGATHIRYGPQGQPLCPTCRAGPVT
jgi:hypothetical protein